MTSLFHNASSAELADDYGTLKGQHDALAKRLDAIKAELIARNVETIEAPKYTVSISRQTSRRLDTKALKQALGEDICAEFERDAESIVLRVKQTVIFGQAAEAL